MKKALAVLALMGLCQIAQAQTPPVLKADDTLVTWEYTGPTPSGFSLERKPGACAAAGTFVEIAGASLIGPTARSFLDSGLPRGTTNCYRAFTVGTFPGERAGPSNTAEKLTPFAPAAPGNLRVQ